VIYLLAIGSAVLYGAADFTGGFTARRAGTLPVVILSQASGLVLFALLMPLLPAATAGRPDLLWGAAAGLAGGIGVALLYHALGIGRMAVVAPTTAVCAVTIPVVVAMLLGERPQPLALAGIALGIASILLVSRHAPTPADAGQGEAKPRSGVGIALASGVAIGFFLLALAQTRREAGMWPLLMARLVSVTFFIGLAAAGRRPIGMPGRIAVLTIAGGILDMFANALYMLAAQVGPLSIVVTLSSLYPASTVVLARVILGEGLNLVQMSGVGCALAAIVLIVSGG
jgi:uncharacterized membrane protein